MPEAERALVMPGTSLAREMVNWPVAVKAALVAKSMRLKTPKTAGIPEITPLTGSWFKPVGRPCAPNVIGVVPVATTGNVKELPCFPAAFVPLVMIGGTQTVSVAGALLVEPTIFEMKTL